MVTPLVTRCRACNEPVIWLRTHLDEAAQFDAFPSLRGDYVHEGRYARPYLPLLHSGMARYHRHSDTCVLAERHGEC